MFANHSGSPASFPAFLPAAIYWAHGIPDCVPHWSTVDKTDKLSVLFELNFGWKDRQNPSTQMHAQLWSCWENLLWVGWSAWGIPGTEEPGGRPSMGLHRVGHDWNDLACMHACMDWRRKWQPIPVFLPGESQGQRSLVGCCLWGCTELDMTDAT